MNTINFNRPLLTVSMQPIENITQATALAEIIGSMTKGKTLKLYGWLKDLQIEQTLVLDDSDKNDLTKLIEDNDNIFINIKGQLLETLK